MQKSNSLSFPEFKEQKTIHDYEETPSGEEIDNAMKNIASRIRIPVQIKRPQRIKHFCLSISDLFCRCLTKCGICKHKEITTESPPKRYIYFGPNYDNKCNELLDNERTTRPPHLENEENEANGSQFVSNHVSTTKYTLLTFIPINLFEQFRKKANFYFLVMACLASTPMSPKEPIFSWMPLIFVLTVSALKEAYEDYQRYQMDKEINHRPVDVFRPDPNGKNWRFQRIVWQEVRVGDMVRIYSKENESFFPSDILLLQSSTNQGLCNIETANLDGETNLKIKQAVSATYSLPTDENGDHYLLNNALQFMLESEAPNENISKWKGALCFHHHHHHQQQQQQKEKEKEAISVGINQMLLRGCSLKNTQWIIGCVVATGIETKISLNDKGKEFKRSNVDKTVDYALYFIFATQQILCILAAIFYAVWLDVVGSKQWYQYIKSDGTKETNTAASAIENYFTFLVLLDILVPISLYVSMEMVKFIQAYLITSDEEMVQLVEDESGHGNDVKIRAQARTSNLNEELGQISYIFSDKTGTLTQNKMAFVKCHIENIRYGPDEMERQNDFVQRVADPPFMPKFSKKCLFTDNRLGQRWKSNEKMNEFLTLLALCHSVIPQYPLGDEGPVVYNASSPDEKALVVFAKNLHFYFYKAHVQMLSVGNVSNIDGHRFYVNIFGDKLEVDIFNLLEFTSKRKRMSVIVRDPRDQKLKVYCKGADNVIYHRLESNYKPNGEQKAIKEWQDTLESLSVFAADGLRTLVLAYKEISEDYYCDWLQRLNKARAAMENRDALVEECYDEIERDFVLIGATAIEDKLQEGVPSTIANLGVAGIAIWVLTGDKVETAINIGRAARLLKAEMNREDGSLIVIDPDEKISDNECEQIVAAELDKAWGHLANHDDNDPNQGFVISGKALSVIFPNKKQRQSQNTSKYQENLLQCLLKCRAVLCCRVSPIQKAQMVALLKNNRPNAITLAIGDGANDVPMIKCAHVGIGICGQEGLQAVMASDYAIGQFRFLEQLLLIHGAWDYRRISVIILYSFYKNVLLSMTQIYFGFYSGFSGTLFYDNLFGSSYNMVYTALPVMFAAVFDRYYTKEIARLCPELYANGPQNLSFSVKVFLSWFFEGILHAMVCFFCAIYVMDSNSIGNTGVMTGFWVSNTTMFTSVVSVATAKMMIETHTWNIWTIIIFILSYLSWYLVNVIWSSIPVDAGFSNQNFYGVTQVAFNLPQFWFVVLIVVVICIFPDILWKFVQKLWRPTRLDVIEELEFIRTTLQCKKGKFLKDIRSQRKEFVNEMLAHEEMQKNPKLQGVKKKQSMDDKLLLSRPSTRSLTKSRIGGEDEQRMKVKQPCFKRAATCPQPKLKSTKSDLGYVDVSINRQHSAYVMSQYNFMKKAMVKKQFSARLSFDDDAVDDDDSDFGSGRRKNKKKKEYAVISTEDLDDRMIDGKFANLKKPTERYSKVRSVDDETDDEEEDEFHPL